MRLSYLTGPLLAVSSVVYATDHVHLPGKCLHDAHSTNALLTKNLDDMQQSLTAYAEAPPLELHPLVTSGPSSNRVDLVFFSDGYLPEEKSKFLADAMVLVDEISKNQTFYTVKPLLNFWAAFSPSEESGVGAGGKPKKTPYGLYRPGTELRALYYAHPEVAAAACASLGTQCDYPILLGNDPLYGGLGGRFTTITASATNGPLILRHELGHSIIPVGEEYDGGFAYFGVNAYHDLSQPVPWAQWLTSLESESRVERSVMPLQDYAWAMLNTSEPWSTTFESSGLYARHVIRCSISGIPEGGDMKVELDGTDLGWVPKEDIGIDRWHYDFYHDVPLSPGEHEIKFTLLNDAVQGTAQMCSVEVLEYGTEEEFVSTPGHYGVYPTYSEKNQTTYRPTNEDCLMRLVTAPNFCSVCIEGLWHALLSKISLIDGITESCKAESSTKVLELSVIPLAHLRLEPVNVVESMMITWKKDGDVVEAFGNRTTVELEGDDALGSYEVVVSYQTQEVRVDEKGNLKDNLVFIIYKAC